MGRNARGSGEMGQVVSVGSCISRGRVFLEVSSGMALVTRADGRVEPNASGGTRYLKGEDHRGCH